VTSRSGCRPWGRFALLLMEFVPAGRWSSPWAVARVTTVTNRSHHGARQRPSAPIAEHTLRVHGGRRRDDVFTDFQHLRKRTHGQRD
jgi:hypothetical protein